MGVVKLEESMENRNSKVDMTRERETTLFKLNIRKVPYGFSFLELSTPYLKIVDNCRDELKSWGL